MLRWFGVYLAGAFLFLAPLSFHPTTRLPDDGDSLQNLWIVWWSATHWDLGYPGILDANGYYPHPRSLLFSEPQFAEALLSTPLFLTFENRVLVYNLLILLTLGLSALGAHWFVRELTGSNLAAFLGAVVYVYNGYTLSQLPRSQLVTLQWIPLALLCLHRFFSRKDWRYLVPFSVFSTLQGFASFYYLQFYLLLLGVLLPFYFAGSPRSLMARRFALVLASALACALPIFFLVRPYLDLFRRYEFSSLPGSMDLLDFFTPAADNPFYAPFFPTPRFVLTFLGYGSLILAGFGLVRLARSTPSHLPLSLGAGYVLAGILGFLLAGGPELIVGGNHLGPGLFRALQLLGPFGSVRDPARFVILVRLSLSVLVALGTLSVLERFPQRRGIVSFLLALILAGEQLSPALTRGVEIPVGDSIPGAYIWAAAHPGKAPMVELPVRPFGLIRLNALEAYFSTHHRRPYLFGKPSVYPPAHELLRTELHRFPEPDTLELLSSLGVELAVVFHDRWSKEDRPHRERQLAEAVRRGSLVPLERFEGGDDETARRYALGPATVYALEAPVREPSTAACRCREIERTSFRLEASGLADPRLAIDGDRRTAWTTGPYQGKGSYFEIDFGRTRKPVRVEIELAYPYLELPRRLSINGFRGERFWRFRRLDDTADTLSLVEDLINEPSRARLRYDLEPMEVDRMRLFIESEPPSVPAWSVPEIHVFEADDALP